VLIFSIFAIFGPFFMFFGKNLLVLLLVFKNCYLKEVVTNTHPWGQEITIQNCHLGFHIDISSTEKNKGPSPSVYPKAGYHLFPPITSLHFFGLQLFASRCKQPLSWQGMEVGKEWRLARNGGWQGMEVGKEWKLVMNGVVTNQTNSKFQ
jgi:hypothetical protein